MPFFFGSPWWPLWVFPLATALVLGVFWLLRGRDQTATLPVAHPFLPPLELSPAQVGTLVDESCDARDIVATLVDLAARGYVEIEEIGERDFLLKPGDLKFRQSENAPPLERLKKHERMFWEAIFDSQPPDVERGRSAANQNLNHEIWHETALSLLQNKFYRHIPPIRAEIYGSLVRGGYFPESPHGRRAFFTTTGAILVIAGFYGSGFGANENGELNPFLSLPLGILFSGLVWLGAASLMAPKSALGTHKAQAARRFASWVKTVSLLDLRVFFTKQPAAFERLFSYAVVLGVGGIWAQKGGDCGQSPPSWFVVPEGETEPGAPAPNAQDTLWRLGEHWNRIERVFQSSPRANDREPEENPTALGA